MPSCSPPTCTPEQAAYLREDLSHARWGVDVVADLLGPVADAALRRDIRLPALRALEVVMDQDREAGRPFTPAAVLTTVFMLGHAVPADALDVALPRTGVRGACQMGLIAQLDDDPTRVRALVDLRPHEASGLGGQEHVRWWVASDLGEMETGRALNADHVLGIGGAGLSLASLTPRREVDSALDLGCGCGIQTLYLLQHARRVVATDISKRALAFTVFNARLAGTDDRLDVRHGSFLDPVASECFDLIATNPPFVLTPPSVREAGLPLMEYRDAGGPVLPHLVPRLGDHLTPGGIAVMLGNWEHKEGQSWTDHVGAWLPPGVDAWVIERESQDPVEYATMWLRDGGVSLERDPRGFEAALDAWIADFDARHVEAVGLGYLILHRPDTSDSRVPWRVLETVHTTPRGPLGAHVERSLAVRSRLAAMSDEQVAQCHPVLAADVSEERHVRPGATDPSVIILRQGGGWARSVRADTALAALAGVADGDLSVAQIADALATLLSVEAPALRTQLVSEVRALAADGFVDL